MFRGTYFMYSETYNKVIRHASLSFKRWKGVRSAVTKDIFSLSSREISSHLRVLAVATGGEKPEFWQNHNLCECQKNCEVRAFRAYGVCAFKSGHAGNNLMCITDKAQDCIGSLLTPKGLSFMPVRYKSSKKKTDTEDTLSDSDDDDDVLEEDDFDAPPKFKVMKIIVSSMRADGIISSALNIARHQMEEEFLGSGLLLNGQKTLKKSVKMDAGDYADLIVERADDQLKVKRVKVLKIFPEKTSKDKFMVKVRVWKSPFLIAKP